MSTPMRTLAIDPGTKESGYAFAEYGVLTAAGYFPSSTPSGSSVTRLVSELPQIYAGHKAQGNVEDLLQLARTVGQFEGHFKSQGAEIVIYRPAQWKGQVPKPIHHERVFNSGVLSNEELKHWPLQKTYHDVRDAICLLLFNLGRTTREGTKNLATPNFVGAKK